MKIKNKKDFGLGVFCILFAALITYLSLHLKATAYKGDPGPKMFPLIGAVIMAVCGIALILAPEKEEKRFLTWTQWKAAFGLFGMYVGLALMLWLFGFKIAVPVVLFIVTLMLSKLSVKDAAGKTRAKSSNGFTRAAARAAKAIYGFFGKLGIKNETVQRRVLISLIYGIVGGVVLYLAYVVGLKTQMPEGLLFELLG